MALILCYIDGTGYISEWAYILVGAIILVQNDHVDFVASENEESIEMEELVDDFVAFYLAGKGTVSTIHSLLI